ncbi:putative DNA-binding transcriptional regulator YafY [Kroppenstedtia sanguinis]
MPKSKRLMELMMTVNRKRRFKVQELADEFGVSKRTILRDLRELSELGVPLYSEVGPHGGYQVIRERVLPPIAFTEEEAVAMFFAVHALRHYSSLPFEAESASALRKFYLHMSGDVRDRIDSMRNRIDFITPTRRSDAPYLVMLLDAAIYGKVLAVKYESKEGEVNHRRIQPVYIYAKDGFWYCKAYCFLRQGYRVFRCDRIYEAAYDTSGTEPLELGDVHSFFI